MFMVYKNAINKGFYKMQIDCIFVPNNYSRNVMQQLTSRSILTGSHFHSCCCCCCWFWRSSPPGFFICRSDSIL